MTFMYLSPLSACPGAGRRAGTLASSVILAMLTSVAMAQSPQTPAKEPVPTPAVAANSVSVPLAILARGPAGITITNIDILSELQKAPEETRRSVLSRPESVTQIVNNLIVRRMLAAEGDRDGLATDPMVAATVAISRERAMSDARLARLDAQNTPTPAALEAYARNVYQAEGAKFDVPAQTRARHILLTNNGPEALKKAKELLVQLKAGASFEELAKTNSTDPGSASRGGDLGFFGAGKMVRPFEDAVNALAKPGDLSEPVESQFGYHIIKLEARREKGRQPFEEVRPQLIDEARTGLLNQSRVLKVQSLNKDIALDTGAIEALTKPAAR
jgi:peptidyl-prolyl cis-trans isomerase C